MTPPDQPDPSASPSLALQLRTAMRGVAATVTIVTTVHRGEWFGMTASSFTSVTLDPPSILVAINRDSSLHDRVLASRRFAVNVLSAGSEEIARRFSSRSLTPAERFEAGDWQQGADGMPLLAEARAALVCRLEHELEVGTHTLVVGRVLAVSVGDGDSMPLVYADGRYHALPPHAV